MTDRERIARIVAPGYWPKNPDWHYKSIEVLVHANSLATADRLIAAGVIKEKE